MQVKLLSGALGAEISGVSLKDTSIKNFDLINTINKTLEKMDGSF